MKDPIQKYFQVGTIQWMSFPNRAPMESLKAIARDDFFDAIELKGYGSPEANAEAKACLLYTSPAPGLLPGKMPTTIWWPIPGRASAIIGWIK